jgi:hypothetical protein
MGSPLSLVIANFYMEDFKERVLDLALLLVGLSLQPPPHAGSLLADFSTGKMEVTHSFEMLVHTRSTRRRIPEDDILHSQCCENLKSYIKKSLIISFSLLQIMRHPTLLDTPLDISH